MNALAEDKATNDAYRRPVAVPSGGGDRIIEFAVPGMGSDHCAGVTLVSGELTKVVEAIRLSKATFRKILQNLFCAWFYNVAAIPIAALGLLHPMIGVVAMTSSSLSVIGNSLLLRRAKLRVDQ